MKVVVIYNLLSNIELPVIMVNEKDIVVKFNEYSEGMFFNKLKENIPLQNIFHQWEKKLSDVYIATLYDKQYEFLRKRCLDSSNILLIGLEENYASNILEEYYKLYNLNRDLSAAFENSYDGIFITDRDGVTIRTNDAIEKITSIPKEYFIGKSVDYLIDRGILKASVTHLVREKKRTASVVQKNFEGKEILLTGTALLDEDGEVEKVITNIRDLSDLNELQTELRKVRKLNEEYKRELSLLKDNKHVIQGAIVKSENMKELYETAERVANIDVTVLISGETGVGKDVLARYIYERSYRAKEGKYIKVNCGAIPEELLESELFGYEAGAFTGADPKGKVGLFEAANNGVLFLDEIGELPLNLQVKLLRVLQEGEIQRVGGVETKTVDVRIIAATNRNLEKMIKQGDFREDLYYRLNVIPLYIPPLRKRRDDIIPLIEFFLQEANKKYNMNKTFSQSTKKIFYNANWRGNVRELSNLIERLVVTTVNDEIHTDDLPPEYMNQQDDLEENKTSNSSLNLNEVVEQAERNLLLQVIEKCNSTYEISKLIGVSQPTVVRKLQKYGLTV